MKNGLKKLLTKIFTFISVKNIKHGNKVKCNYFCSFTNNTILGTNCHFNGIKISGRGNVHIGNNFHSGKNIRIITTFHNYLGNALPYDNTYIDKDVVIEDNVWLGESVVILGGVTIGEGAIIQTGSIVCKDIPALAIAGGHPAVPFKFRDKDHYYDLKKKESFY